MTRARALSPRRRAAAAGALAALALWSCKGERKEEAPAPTAPTPATAVGAPTAPAPPDAPVAPVALPPAPPLPSPPLGLPAPPAGAAITAEQVALGALLFAEPRLAADGKTTCATCHVPAEGYAGGRVHTALGRPNLRRAPALINLAWQRELGWDGYFETLEAHLPAHLHGQLGAPLEAALPALAADPTLLAHFERAFRRPPDAEAAAVALAAFVRTRYSGDSRWDREERRDHADPILRAGYALFLGKAQCSVCHPPPLYTDLGYHRLGLIAAADEGRGRVEPARRGAFKTPTLRDAARRTSFFHDGSAGTLADAVRWHLDGGVGQGAARAVIDPALAPVALSEEEVARLLAFLTALRGAEAP
ncbi:MAG: cytochrome c peroxidase [Kofleriaceae bacterium]